MSSKSGAGPWDQMVVDFQGPEDTAHALMGAGEVQGPGKSEGPLVQKASGLVQEQEMDYSDLLQIEKEKRERDIHEGVVNVRSW